MLTLPDLTSAKKALALVNLGNCFAIQGNLDEAIKAYKGSVHANPDVGVARVNLASMYF